MFFRNKRLSKNDLCKFQLLPVNDFQSNNNNNNRPIENIISKNRIIEGTESFPRLMSQHFESRLRTDRNSTHRPVMLQR